MESLCPECMGTLVMNDGGTARCTVHGGEYRVLYKRAMDGPPMSPTSSDAGTPAGQGSPPLMDAFCVQHPAVAASRKCQLCGAYMCETCDFVLPGDVHLCPACATKPQTELSPRRRRSRAWSFGCAIWVTLWMVALLSGVFAHVARDASGRQAFGTLLTFMVLIPAIIGGSVGLGAIERRLANPPSLWAATIWNWVIVVLFLLLALVGIMRS